MTSLWSRTGRGVSLPIRHPRREPSPGSSTWVSIFLHQCYERPPRGLTWVVLLKASADSSYGFIKYDNEIIFVPFRTFNFRGKNLEKIETKIDPNTNYGQLITWTGIAVSSTNSLKRWMLNHVITRSLGFDPHLRCLNFSAPPFRSQRLLYFDGWVGNSLIDTCMFLDSEKR